MRRRTVLLLAAPLVALGSALAVWSLSHRPEGPAQADLAIDAATASAVIEATLTNLKEAYVFPEVAVEIERGLKAERPALQSIASAEAFARALTVALQGLAHQDQHLEVSYSEAPIPERTDDTPSAEKTRMHEQYARRRNAGFEVVQRFPGNVGLLELKKFYPPELVAPRLPAAMRLLADTGALIIDLRECGGGVPETVMLVASYFFDRRTHLNDIFWRDEQRTEERWTDPAVEGLRYGEQRPLYLLVSRETASGCEDFAYALKNAGRATLVGETTAGAAHAGSRRRVGEHFQLFVPSGRPINPVTHGDWERVGVQPDLPTSAKKALRVARGEVLRRLAAVETDPDWRVRLEHAREELE